MEGRSTYIVIAIVGIAIILASIFAHQLGLGAAGFGTKKLAGTVVGAIVLAGALWGMVYSARVPAV